MEAVVEASQPLLVDVGVDLGGRDVGMAEHRLDRAEVGPVLEQVGREAVPQHVGRDRLDAGRPGVLPEDLPEALPA